MQRDEPSRTRMRAPRSRMGEAVLPRPEMLLPLLGTDQLGLLFQPFQNRLGGDRHVADPYSDGVVDRVRNRRRHDCGCGLPNSAWVMACINQLHIDWWHVRQPYRRVFVEVALLESTVLQG